MVSSPVNVGSASGRVTAAIRMASERTGVDFSYLYNQARVESGLNPNAQARTSSARGLFQFIDQSWLATVNNHGRSHGLGWAADAIRQNSQGRYVVDDPNMRRSILALRDNPDAASAMAAEFAADNRDHLQGALGHAVEDVDLYLAHFLGPGGATRFLRAHDRDPSAAAAPLLPQAARANRSIFYARGGQPRSLAEIRARFAARMDSASPAAPPGTPEVPPGTPPAPSQSVEPAIWQPLPSDQLLAAPSPSLARMAYLMLAQMGAEI
ncbi:MAG: transglycosylase SLT domain-containing protein [Sphingopyxis sp.]